MKASELRIGNWVEMYKEESKPFKISAGNISVEYKANKQGYTRYKPIPLTEEWLIRFGFEDVQINKTQVKCLTEYQFSFFFIDGHIQFVDSENALDFTETLCQYVHQLQNLFFALTGEELKIKE